MNRNTDTFIPFALPSIGKEEEEAVLSVMRSGWLTTGKETFTFEKEFSDYIGVPYSLALNSATAGLHLALEALHIQPGDLLITSPFTFTSTAEVTRYLGANPLFADIEEDSFNIDPDQIVRRIDSKNRKSSVPEEGAVKAIVPVHVGGSVCDMDRINEIARKYGCSVVEDAAHSFPSFTGTRYAGTMGDAGVFSFYATKPITTGEGGMLVTENRDIAKRVSIMRLHGIDREVWNRYQAKGHTSWKYDIIAPGYKYNMTDISAAIGRVQLKRAEDFLQMRKRIAETYLSAFREFDFITCPQESPGHSWHLFIVTIVPEKLTIGRDEFVKKMMERGVGTSVHYIPLHLMSYYRKRYGLKPDDFPNAYKKYSTCFSLPIYPGLTEEQIHYIIDTVKEIGTSHRKRK